MYQAPYGRCFRLLQRPQANVMVVRRNVGVGKGNPTRREVKALMRR